MKEQKITIVPTNPLHYSMDGSLLGLPIAKGLKQRYKHSRWLPVTFKLWDTNKVDIDRALKIAYKYVDSMFEHQS
jgi:hypothetical protein